MQFKNIYIYEGDYRENLRKTIKMNQINVLFIVAKPRHSQQGWVKP